MSQAWIYTIVYFAWLIGAACFVLGLHLMNSPATGRNGNRLSAAGMVLAVGATLVDLIVRPEGLSVNGTGDHRRRLPPGRRGRAVHGPVGEDDRDAAAGVAVQRGRRWGGGPGRDRRLHQARGRRRRSLDHDLRGPGRPVRLGHLHRLADRRRQAPGPDPGQADRGARRPDPDDRDRRDRPDRHGRPDPRRGRRRSPSARRSPCSSWP